MHEGLDISIRVRLQILLLLLGHLATGSVLATSSDALSY